MFHFRKWFLIPLFFYSPCNTSVYYVYLPPVRENTPIWITFLSKIWCTSITVLWGCNTVPVHGQAILADSWMPPSPRWPWWQRLHICAWIQNASKWKHFFNYSETKWSTTSKRAEWWLCASQPGSVSLTGFCSSPTVWKGWHPCSSAHQARMEDAASNNNGADQMGHWALSSVHTCTQIHTEGQKGKQ